MKNSKSNSSKQLLKLALESLEDDKAIDVISINPVSYTHLTLPTNREV